MVKKTLLSLLLLGVLGYAAYAFLVPTVSVPPSAPAPTEGEEVSFLTLPDGFRATYFAKNVPGARVMEFVPGGLLVSQTREGKVSLINEREGKTEVRTVLSGLNSPHGLASRCDDGRTCDLYVAEHDALSRYHYENGVARDRQKLISLSASLADRHKTRTLLFLPAPREDTLLISVGSSCDVCHDEGQRGKIIAYDTKTGEVSEYARGLRNAVFMTLNPINGLVFATEMGRDNLGDDLPPDEINVIEPARGIQNFGWPICYGKNMHDTNFDKNTYIRNPCMEPFEAPSWLDLQAHSAPLGLSFIPEEGWPEDMWFDLLIAYHGSWNRSIPTGYKIVKVDIDGRGNPGEPKDFITGWLTENGTKHGRPADVKALPGGAIYISDDYAGAIYKISSNNES